MSSAACPYAAEGVQVEVGLHCQQLGPPDANRLLTFPSYDSSRRSSLQILDPATVRRTSHWGPVSPVLARADCVTCTSNTRWQQADRECTTMTAHRLARLQRTFCLIR